MTPQVDWSQFTPAEQDQGVDWSQFSPANDAAPEDAYPDQVSRAASRPQVTAPPLADTEDSVSRRADARQSPKQGMVDRALDTGRDLAASALKIGPTALGGLADIGNMVTGDTVDLGVSKAMEEGKKTIDSYVASKKFNDDQAGLAKVMADDKSGVLDMMSYAFEHPSVLVDQSITTIGSMLLPAGVASKVGKMAQAAGKSTPAIEKLVEASAIGTTVLQNAADTFSATEGKTLAERYSAAAISGAVTFLVGKATGGGAEAEIAKRLAGAVKSGAVSPAAAIRQFGSAVGKGAVREGAQEYGEEVGGVAGEMAVGKDSSAANILKRTAMAGTLGAIVGGGSSVVQGARDLPGQISEGRAQSAADAAQAGAEAKAADMFGGMVPAAPGQAQPIRPPSDVLTPPPGPLALPEPGRTVAEVSAQPLPVTEIPTTDPAQAHADAVYAARAEVEARRAAAPQTASQIAIDPNDPAAAIAAIAAAPITQIGVGVSTPAGVDPAAHSAAAGDLAGAFLEIEQLKQEVKATPPKARPAVQARLDAAIKGARAEIETHRAQFGDEAARTMHRAAAETFHALKGDYTGLQRPAVQVPAASTGREQGAELNVEVPALDAKMPPPPAAARPMTTPIGPAARAAAAEPLPAIELPGAVDTTGIHYGTTPGLPALSGSSYGTGASRSNGEESARLKDAAPEVRQRVYFYQHDGVKLPAAEGVVTGNHTYEAQLTGLLDITSEPAKKLIKGVPRDAQGRLDLNAFEKAVHDAGYTGYQHGDQIVTLGRDVPAKYLGTRFEASKALKAKEESAAAKPEAAGKESSARTLPGVGLAAVKEATDTTAMRVAGTDPNKALKSAYPTARATTQAESRLIGRLLQGALNAGLHPDLLSGLNSVHAYPGRGGSNARHLSVSGHRSIGVSDEMLRALMQPTPDPQLAQEAITIVIHELWHEQDNHFDGNDWTSRSSQSPRFAMSVTNGVRYGDGDVMNEAMTLFGTPDNELSPSGRALKEYLRYPMDYLQEDVDTGGRDETTAMLQEELAAQLFALWYTAPVAMKRELPLAAALFKEIDDAISKQKRTDNPAGVRSTVGSILAREADGGRQGSVAPEGQAAGSGKESESRQPSNRELTEKDRAGVLDHLQMEERVKLNRGDAAKKFIKTFLEMPSSKEMAAIAWAGKAKRGWYRNAAFALHHVFGMDAPRFTALLAATSPRTSVESNLKAALQTWVEWNKLGRPTTHSGITQALIVGVKGTSALLGTNRNNVIRALSHPRPEDVVISGPKVDSFFRNLMGDVYQVTNDGWMAAYADVDANIFGGASTPLEKTVTDAGKGFGYLAMSAHVRQAAKMLTQKTGEIWTPAEVQETIWSWAKTLYEMAGVGKSALDIVNNKEITDALISATPDFGSLLSEGDYANILTKGGFGAGVSALAEARRRSADVEGQHPQDGAGKAQPFTGGVQQTLEQRAASRLDALRAKRAAASEAKAAADGQAAEGDAAQGQEGVAYDPEDPANANYRDFYEDPEAAITKPGWAILTATQEGKGEEFNAMSNEDLAAKLNADGYKYQEVRGVWQGMDQGRSFLIFAPTEYAMKLAKQFGQQAIATNKGFEYADGKIDAADHSRTTVGADAREQPGYTILPDGTAISMGFPPEGKESNNRSKVTDSTELAGDGRGFTDFFTEASRGNRAPDAKVPYEPVLDISSISEFSDEYVKHRGNFDDHIATSIPGFREVQQAVGAAIVGAYPEGAKLLDIAASEGAFNKAISALSGGKIETLALDPNLQMAKFFAEHSTVPGATYEVAAFGSKEDAGKVAWTEDDGTKIRTFKPEVAYDIVHEAMGFQFISNTRNAQFARVKEMMAPDGIAIFEEKVKEDTRAWRSNEAKKDAYKARYFTAEQLKAKAAEVLEKGKEGAAAAESEREQAVVGMNDLMTTGPEFETALKNNWKYVSQYWDSGNFKGYVASDDAAAVGRFLGQLTDLNSEYSTVDTPHSVGARLLDESAMVKVEAVEEGTGRPVEITMVAREALRSIDADIAQTRKLLLCLSS